MAVDIKKYSNEILYRDFFYSEIIKRHVEEFDRETWNYLNQLKESLKDENNTFHIGFTHYENIFNVVLGEAIDMYRLVKNGYTPLQSIAVKKMIHDVPELFSFKDKQLYDKLLDISYRYNIIATEIVFPCNMRNVIEKYSKKQFSHWTYKFKTVISDHISIFKLGEKFFIEIDDNTINEDDVDFLKVQFILDRNYNKKIVRNEDYDFIRRVDKKHSKEKFRVDAFIKNAIGLYCWDLEKNTGNYSDAFTVYNEYQKTIGKCKNDECFIGTENKNTNNKLKSHSSCPRDDTCRSFVREARRLSRLNIKSREIYSSTQKGEADDPQHKDTLQRYPLSFFQGK